MATRRFTLRRNGHQMTTFRVRIDLSQKMIDELIVREAVLGGERQAIEDILSHCLSSGIERLTLDSSLDPEEEDR